MSDNENDLIDIHALLTNKFKEILNNEKVTASELNVIRQFLKDNNIECDGTKNEQIQSVFDDLPFDTPIITTVSEDLKN